MTSTNVTCHVRVLYALLPGENEKFHIGVCLSPEFATALIAAHTTYCTAHPFLALHEYAEQVLGVRCSRSECLGTNVFDRWLEYKASWCSAHPWTASISSEYPSWYCDGYTDIRIGVEQILDRS